MGSLKAEVVDENTPRTTIRLDLVCVPNLVVFGPAVLEKNTTKQKNRCLKNINLYIYIFIYMHIYIIKGQAWRGDCE